jgi:hypothetical protein|tara:strand:+ start:15702 stop:16112 length:411 start_codon:yes stop_codon:yes gene_type:complete
MDLYLHRTHYQEGTNGALFYEDQLVCFTIELPWRCNARNVSCIPDGTYEMTPFYSPEFKHHLRLLDVPDRSGILLHPANDALTELRGCIAPVSQLTGIGKGLGSRRALDQLLMRVEAFREEGEAVFLTVCSEQSGR